MKLTLRTIAFQKHYVRLSKKERSTIFFALTTLFFTIISFQLKAQGTWTPVATNCPGQGGGGLILLSDGSVMCKTFDGGVDGYGNTWYQLKPNAQGSYINGTWTKLKAMKNTRLYFSSQILKDGRVYVAGGEYGTGGSSGEVYNPLTDSWTQTPAPGAFVSDANSEILEDGRVLQAIVQGNPFLKQNEVYNPLNNTYGAAPSCIGAHNESSWIKLQDNSILMVDRGAQTSERYIPSLNQWIADANVPVALYDPWGLETGAALLLPDGRGFFIGSLGHTAYYTPSGNTSPGTWAAGPDIPNAQGQPDAPAAMMPNGKILFSCSPIPTSFNHFPTPTSYYEFNYLTNTYTRINAPGGGLTRNIPCYTTTLIDLPDGTVLYSEQGLNTFYIYTPDGTPLNSGKPKIKNIRKVAGTNTYRITGTRFNGISEGAAYGDDWQMASNYPIVRFTAGGNVYYARSFNWNSTGVRRGSARDTVFITLPPGLPGNTSLALTVTANGITSDPLNVQSAAFAPSSDVIANNILSGDLNITQNSKSIVFPNPAKEHTTVQFAADGNSRVSIKIIDLNGKVILDVMNKNLQKGIYSQQINTSALGAGVYIVRIITEKGTENIKLLVQ